MIIWEGLELILIDPQECPPPTPISICVADRT